MTPIRSSAVMTRVERPTPAMGRRGVPVPRCRLNPQRWDMPTDAQPHVLSEWSRQVVSECRACPASAACEQEVADCPPIHDCVQAARVFYKGRVYQVKAFRKLVDEFTKRPYHAGISTDDYRRTLERMMGEGLSDGQIAAELNLTAYSVRSARLRFGLRRHPAGLLTLKPCGTTAAAQRHRQRKEALCDACRAADRADFHARKTRRRGTP